MARPLPPGRTAREGFSYSAVHPPGITRNGGGARSFILPAGVVLSTRERDFLPVPGFVDDAGAGGGERQPAPARFPDGAVPAPRLGSTQPAAFTTRVHVELAAVRGEPFAVSGFDEQRVMVRLAPGQPRVVEWQLGFQPEQIVADPDALVLQLNRDLAVADLRRRAGFLIARR